MRDKTEFIGKSWTLEIKSQHLYVTNAKSGATMSTTDLNYPQPSSGKVSTWYVPAYVLRQLRDLAARAEREVENQKPAVIPPPPPHAVPATIPTILHAYSIDVTEAQGRAAYDKLRDDLHALGLSKGGASLTYSRFANAILPLDGREILLETQWVFCDQWNTAATTGSETGLRVFDWAEMSGTTIKWGYWLEPKDETRNARAVRHVCGYCGHQEDILTEVPPEGVWCQTCLGSEYLRETELSLLRLLPVGQDRIKSGTINATVPGWLVEHYLATQRTARCRRLAASKVAKLANLQQGIENAQTEYDAFQWLIARDIDFDNVIFYDHSGTFCFGWREPLSREEAEKIEAVLKDVAGGGRDVFAYKYEFKTC
ncbi:hypothetical protein M0R72_08875 [Candidatus Pacearchaeota archaeon]|jgi:hypothetical protein|nr:hypothetical protein [Candidatus Pacearchaeota archaeon]